MFLPVKYLSFIFQAFESYNLLDSHQHLQIYYPSQPSSQR